VEIAGPNGANPESNELLAKIAGPAVAKAKVEAKEIQDLIDGQNGGFKLEPWDWNFYSEQVRKAKYDLDESQVKPYFELTTVLEKRSRPKNVWNNL
jgi:peptidyl-dipeptidase Dcp